jgi:hypothetical protein
MGEPPLLLAAQLYQRLLSIHPFQNGNGRTARLVLDWLLLRQGLPPAVFGNDNPGVAVFGTVPLDCQYTPTQVVTLVTAATERALAERQQATVAAAVALG